MPQLMMLGNAKQAHEIGQYLLLIPVSVEKAFLPVFLLNNRIIQECIIVPQLLARAVTITFHCSVWLAAQVTPLTSAAQSSVRSSGHQIWVKHVPAVA
jgi:hypothetical protein